LELNLLRAVCFTIREQSQCAGESLQCGVAADHAERAVDDLPELLNFAAPASKERQVALAVYSDTRVRTRRLRYCRYGESTF
jgi:hypothetical protein